MTLLAAGGPADPAVRQDDVVIGTPVANRSRVEIEPLIGFLSTACIAADLSGSRLLESSYTGSRPDAGSTTRQIAVRAVVEIVRPPRNLAYAPVFQVMFACRTRPND